MSQRESASGRLKATAVQKYFTEDLIAPIWTQINLASFLPRCMNSGSTSFFSIVAWVKMLSLEQIPLSLGPAQDWMLAKYPFPYALCPDFCADDCGVSLAMRECYFL